jgi:hypothetical protein
MADENQTDENMTDEEEDLGPVTLTEWQEYVDGLKTDDEIYENALAAGTLKFGQKLLAEGYSAEDVTAIRRMMALKMATDRVAPPGRVGGCLVDYRALVPTGTFDF